MPTNLQVQVFIPGQSIGKFRIIREIGRGGMGVVYLAEDTTLTRKVAIKVLKTFASSDSVLRERALQEARASAALQHPHIVRVNSCAEFEGLLTIEMEYADGGSLADVMLSGPLPPERVALLAHQTLQALAQCHKEGIVHRDIKPSNILLDKEGRVLLSDFGLAKVLAYSQQIAMVSTASSVVFVGTPRYAPPEAWDDADASPAWDIYSMGMVMYECLTGRAPYDALTPLALAKQISNNPPKPIRQVAPQVSEEFGDLIDDMLQSDPLTRPNNAIEILHRLARVPEARDSFLTSPTVIPRSTPISALRRRVRRLRRILAAVPARRAFAMGALLASIVAAAIIGGLGIVQTPQWDSLLPDAYLGQQSQQALLRSRVPSTAAISSVWKDTSDPRPAVFASYVHQDGTSRDPSWILYPTPDPNVLEAWTVSDNETGFMVVRSNGGKELSFEGNWAGYRDPGGRVFRSGTVEGRGFWVEPGTSFSASLDFESRDDGSRWSRTITTMRSTTCLTDSAFIRQFETSELLPSLLFNDLIPRRQAWPERIVKRLPMVLESRITVPFQSAVPAPIVVDGKVDDVAWKQDYVASGFRVGTMPGYPVTSNALLRALYSDDAVFLAFSAHVSEPGAKTFELALVRKVSVPPQDSVETLCSIRPDAPPQVRQLRSGREIALREEWTAAIDVNANRISVEVVIPLNRQENGEPISSEWWRFAAAIVDGDRNPVCFWGYPETGTPYHGALVQFAAPASQQPQTAEHAD